MVPGFIYVLKNFRKSVKTALAFFLDRKIADDKGSCGSHVVWNLKVLESLGIAVLVSRFF